MLSNACQREQFIPSNISNSLADHEASCFHFEPSRLFFPGCVLLFRLQKLHVAAISEKKRNETKNGSRHLIRITIRFWAESKFYSFEILCGSIVRRASSEGTKSEVKSGNAAFSD